MQTFRDAAVLLIVILLVLSVRVTGNEGAGIVEPAFAGETRQAGLGQSGPAEVPALAKPEIPSASDRDRGGDCPHGGPSRGDTTAGPGDCLDCDSGTVVDGPPKHVCT
jgi:hypothetical protein